VITAVSLESGEWVRRFASTASYRRLSAQGQWADLPTVLISRDDGTGPEELVVPSAGSARRIISAR
jgi:hypothetical protein